MANALYDDARRAFLEAEIDWLTDTIKCVLVDTGAYTYSAAHVNLGSISEAACISTYETLASKATTGGAADAADVTFAAVGPSGTTLEAIVIYKEVNGAVRSDNPLIAYIDQATGLPITANGGDIIVTWDNGVNKIFRL